MAKRLVVGGLALLALAASDLLRESDAAATQSPILLFNDGKSVVGLVPSGSRSYSEAHIFSLPRGSAEVLGLATSGRDVFMSALDAGQGSLGQGSVYRFHGGRVRRLIAGIPFPASVVASGGQVYWLGGDAIGRVGIDGHAPQRSFVRVTREPGGAIGDGLATDGRYLYFSRCQSATIARVRLNGKGLNLNYVRLTPHSCPQTLAYRNGNLFWALPSLSDFGNIGRSTIATHKVEPRWLRVYTAGAGPYSIAADDDHIYWTWGGHSGPISIGDGSVSHRVVLRRSLWDTDGGDALAVP